MSESKTENKNYPKQSSPYKDTPIKDGMDLEVTKCPADVGFGKKDGPVPPEKGVVVP